MVSNDNDNHDNSHNNNDAVPSLYSYSLLIQYVLIKYNITFTILLYPLPSNLLSPSFKRRKKSNLETLFFSVLLYINRSFLIYFLLFVIIDHRYILNEPFFFYSCDHVHLLLNRLLFALNQQ